MNKERNLLDEWNPNPYFMILALIFYVSVVYFASNLVSLLILIGFLSLGWAFSFARPKKNKNRRSHDG